MPIYEYGCRACGKEFEVMMKYEQRLAAQACPACGARETSLRLSVPAHVGSGTPAGGAAAGEPGICPGTGNVCGCGLN